MKRHLLTLLAALLPAAATGQPAPFADNHQHLFSPEISALIGVPPITAGDLVPLLDQARMRRAVLLSVAYIYGSPSRTVTDEYAKVRAENDWVAAQAAEYPQRLMAFCGFNPLKEYALDELARCAAHPGLRHGIKLHFGNSDVQLENPAHFEQVRRVFRAANEHGMAIVLHLRANISRRRPYGAEQANAFLELLREAPDVPVQVAHLAAAGPGYDDVPAQTVMGVLADAVRRGDPRARNLWFDVTTVANGDIPPGDAEKIVQYIRQVGVDRVLFGSDAATTGNLPPAESWAAFRRLMLEEDEFARIARNVAPYLIPAGGANGGR